HPESPNQGRLLTLFYQVGESHQQASPHTRERGGNKHTSSAATNQKSLQTHQPGRRVIITMEERRCECTYVCDCARF
ncbi:hypothetical protein TSAR_007100, partial [Trichomalopsis sarcophagae]